jgi:PKD repeat protein
MRNSFLIPLLLIANVVDLKSQSGHGSNLETYTSFQSDYIWISNSKFKFNFYLYDLHNANHGNFYDEGFVGIYHGTQRIFDSIVINRDSIFLIDDVQYCKGKVCTTSICPSDNPNIYTIYRYSGIIDFSDPEIATKLNSLNICDIDIAFWGGFNNYNNTSNFKTNSQIQPIIEQFLFCSFSINRCFNWKAGDRSPTFRKFHHPDWQNLAYQKGTIQLDFGCHNNDADSVVYELSQPKALLPYAFTFVTIPFADDHSFNYYINSFCRNGSPCAPNPNSNPPQGFYLNSQTGVSIHHQVDFSPNFNIFCIAVKSFKRGSSGQQNLVSTQIRNLTNFYFGANYNDTLKNTRPKINNLPYRIYKCANQQSDTITFNMSDKQAQNQTFKDTVAYRVFQNLPEGSFWVSKPGTDQLEMKVAWNPQMGNPWQNPYLFNIEAYDKTCTNHRMLNFRSCEFHVVQMPKFKIVQDTLVCGQRKFNAVAIEPDPNFYHYQWRFVHSTGVEQTAIGRNPSASFSLGGNWQIQLDATNTQRGCTNRFYDSFNIGFGVPQVVLSPRDTTLCLETALTYRPVFKEQNNVTQYNWQFMSQSSSDSFFVFNQIDSGLLKIQVTNAEGCVSRDSVMIRLYKAVKFSAIRDTAFCFGGSVSISAQPNHPQDGLLWEHNQSNSTNQEIDSAGLYIVSYTNSDACTARDSFEVKATEPLIPAKINDQTYCKGDSIHLIQFLSGGIQYDSSYWVVNGNRINTAFYKDKIQKAVSLELHTFGKQHQISCQASDTMLFDVYPTYSNQLNINKIDSCEQTNVIEAQVIGNETPQSQFIVWGDGQTENHPWQTHRYASVGDYTIELHSTTNNNCKDTQSAAIKIHVQPTASFQLADSIECLNEQPIAIELSNAQANEQHTINWGDAQTEALSGNGVFTHRYAQAGVYSIQLTSRNTAQCESVQTINQHILPSPEMLIEPLSFCIGTPILINTKSNPYSNVIKYQWELNGNVMPSQDSFLVHTFAAIGTYNIRLQTEANNGCKADDTAQVSIIEHAKADFTFANLSQELKYKYQFVNQSKHANAYEWLIENNIIRETSPSHVFSDTGFYQVMLIADQNKICYDTMIKTIPVFEKLTFYYPNVFSPDGNNINDGFGLNETQKLFVKEFYIEIINRWGEKIFTSLDVNTNWQANKVQQGVYIYQSKIRDIFGILHEVNGVVEVLR